MCMSTSSLYRFLSFFFSFSLLNHPLNSHTSRYNAWKNSPSTGKSADLSHESRRIAYMKAISSLRGAPRPVRDGHEAAQRLKYISKSIADKIDELRSTGKIAKVEELCEGEYGKTMMLFGGVHGVGPATALRWYNSGKRMLADLQDVSLTHAQQVSNSFFFVFFFVFVFCFWVALFCFVLFCCVVVFYLFCFVLLLLLFCFCFGLDGFDLFCCVLFCFAFVFGLMCLFV